MFEEVFTEQGIKFYVNGTFTDDLIETSVQGTHLFISKTNIARIFETNEEGVDPFIYKKDRWVLRRKYRLLITILTKSILGEQNSHNVLSKPRLYFLRAIVDGVKVDWAEVL